MHPQLGNRELSSPYIFVSWVLLTCLPYHLLPSNPEKTLVAPSLPPGVGWETSTSPRIRACVQEFLISSFPSFYLLLRVPPPGHSETVCFIYSFIQFSTDRSIMLNNLLITRERTDRFGPFALTLSKEQTATTIIVTLRAYVTRYSVAFK